MHSIELKFGKYILHQRPRYCIDFGEFSIKSFLQEHKKKSYALLSKESNYQTYASVETVLSIMLKFDVYCR